MKSWFGAIALLTLWAPVALAAPADPGKPEEAAKKLPVDMPTVLIHGEDETAGPLLPGNKLAPDVPGAMAFRLPSPRTALDLDRYLAAASQSVKPPIKVATESLLPAITGFRELRLGTSGPNRYDLGAYVGQTFDLPANPLGKKATALGELQGLTAAPWTPAVGGWSSWQLRLEGTASDSTTAGLQLGHRSTLIALNQDDDLAQTVLLTGRTRYQGGVYGLRAEGGRVAAPAALNAGVAAWDGAFSGNWQPDWGYTGHTLDLAADLGGYATDRLTYPLAYLRASDEWVVRSGWTLDLGLGAGQEMGAWIADPALSVTFKPSDATDLTAGIRSESTMPTFSDLYLSRRYVAGNAALLDQRVPVRFDLAASHRLSDRWYARASAAFLQADRWLAWRQAPGAAGLWQPFNPGYSGDTGSPAQQAILGELAAQYQANHEASLHVFYRWRSVQPLAEIAQEAGVTHESLWWHDRVTVDLGGSIRLEQLGSTQVAGGPVTGTQALVSARATYHWTETVAPFVRLDALPLIAAQPAANYFAPDTLLTAGVVIGF
jgi:hypothetical protein